MIKVVQAVKEADYYVVVGTSLLVTRNEVFMTLLPDIVQPAPTLLYNVIHTNL